jgi:hypothetical protein
MRRSLVLCEAIMSGIGTISVISEGGNGPLTLVTFATAQVLRCPIKPRDLRLPAEF